MDFLVIMSSIDLQERGWGTHTVTLTCMGKLSTNGSKGKKWPYVTYIISVADVRNGVEKARMRTELRLKTFEGLPFKYDRATALKHSPKNMSNFLEALDFQLRMNEACARLVSNKG